MKQKIIPILILALATIAIFGYLFVLPLLESENTTEIQDQPPVPDKIKEKIDKLGDKDWDVDYFTEIEDYITEFYKEKNQTGSPEEDNALVALDMGYMTTLNKAMEDLDNCLNYSSDLKDEITVFLKKYPEGSKEIKKANSWFITKSSVKKLPSKVSKLLSKRYDENSYNKIKNTIKKLKESNHYNKKISRCDKLSKIIKNANQKITEFEQIDIRYKVFLSLDKEEEFPNGGVTYDWREEVEGYTWYKNEVEKVHQALKYKYKLVQKINSLKQEIQGDRDDEKIDKLNKLKKELEELDKIE